MNKHFISAILLTLCSCQLLMAQGFSDYEWKEDMVEAKDIPAEFLEADAIIVNKEVYSRGTVSGTFPYIEQLTTFRDQVHVKILKEEAIEDYNRLVLQRFKGRIADFVQYKYVDVRIRRADGTVENFNVRDLKTPTLDRDDDLYARKDDLFIYEIPDLKVGDELERITVLEYKFPDGGRTVNLYDDYPVLTAKYTISTPLKVNVKGRSYNNMPEPSIRTTSTNRIFSWEMTNLKPVPEANSTGTMYQNDLEYFVYELNFDAYRATQLSFKVNNFADQIMQYSEDFLKVRVRKKKKLEEFYENLFAEGAKLFGKKPEELQPVERVYLLNEHLVKNVQLINEELEDYEKSEGIEYFLLNGRTDYRNLMRIYRDFFERFEIPYYVAIGKNRLSGPIDLGFVSPTQIGSYFFVFKNGDGYLAVNGMDGLNELPWSFYDTECYMRDITDQSAKLQTINFGADMLKDLGKNKRTSRSKVQVSLKNNSMVMQNTTSSSGLYARGSRSGMINGHKADTLTKTMQQSLDYQYEAYKDIEAKVKTVKVERMETSPTVDYAFKYSSEIEYKGLLEPKEGVFQLPIEELIGHSIRNVVNAENRILDYHVPFLGTDKDEVYLIFDQEVTISNLEALNKTLDNEYAAYTFSVKQMKPNMIRIQSIYQVKQLFIDKKDVTKLDAVNQIYKDLRDTKLDIQPKA